MITSEIPQTKHTFCLQTFQLQNQNEEYYKVENLVKTVRFQCTLKNKRKTKNVAFEQADKIFLQKITKQQKTNN